jgi:hypothetical protein
MRHGGGREIRLQQVALAHRARHAEVEDGQQQVRDEPEPGAQRNPRARARGSASARPRV